jgi:hypothetical protein
VGWERRGNREKEGHSINKHGEVRGALVLRERERGIGCVSGETTGFSHKFESEGDDIGMRK